MVRCQTMAAQEPLNGPDGWMGAYRCLGCLCGGAVTSNRLLGVDVVGCQPCSILVAYSIGLELLARQAGPCGLTYHSPAGQTPPYRIFAHMCPPITTSFMPELPQQPSCFARQKLEAMVPHSQPDNSARACTAGGWQSQGQGLAVLLKLRAAQPDPCHSQHLKGRRGLMHLPPHACQMTLHHGADHFQSCLQKHDIRFLQVGTHHITRAHAWWQT